jgi:hypothetical protein
LSAIKSNGTALAARLRFIGVQKDQAEHFAHSAAARLVPLMISRLLPSSLAALISLTFKRLSPHRTPIALLVPNGGMSKSNE